MLLIKKLNHKSLKITDIIDEGRDVKTFLFDRNATTVPGKFVLAGTVNGEKPFAISYERPLGITIKRIPTDPSNPETGKFTNSTFKMCKGDRMTITGPEGRGFPLQRFQKGRLYTVGGGSGIATLAYLSEKLKYYKTEIINFLGAKTSEDIFMEDRFHGEMHIVTEDGSKGERGLVTQPLRKYYEKAKASLDAKLASCGPEKMEYNIALASTGFIRPENMYFSLEGIMRCAQGICGSCVRDDVRICVDGPVRTYKQLKSAHENDVPDFGNFKRDRCGRKEPL